jgi:uracil phosphoribosyltransferase
MAAKVDFKAPHNLTIVNHPLVLHKLTLMRDKHTPTAVFRQLLREISLLLAYEVCRDLPMTTRQIETPVAAMEAPVLEGKKLVIVSVLRAGNGKLKMITARLDLNDLIKQATI